MKRLWLRVAVLSGVVLWLSPACGEDGCKTGVGPECPLANAEGIWSGSASDNTGPGSLFMVLQQSGESVTGTFEGIDEGTSLRATGSVTGTVSGNALRGQLSGTFAEIGCALALSFTAQLAEASMSGTYSGTSCTGPVTGGQFNLAKQSDVPTVGPGGGTVIAAGGNVVLVFPPGAVSENIAVRVQGGTGYPTDPGLVDGTVFHFAPDGIHFARPVHLTIRYDPARLPAGVPEGSLRLARLVGGAWEEVAGSSVDETGKAVTGSVTGFSTLADRAPPNGEPSLVSLSPSSEMALASGFTLRVEGENFVQFSKVRWNGADRPTRLIDAHHLEATIPSGDVAAPSIARVTVVNPPPAGGTSGELKFCVQTPATGSTFTWPVDCHAAPGRAYAEFGPFLRDGGHAYHTGTDISQTTSDGYNYTTVVRAAWHGIVTKIFGLGSNSVIIPSNLRRWHPGTDTYTWEQAPKFGENPAGNKNAFSNHGLGLSVIVYHPDLQLYTLYGHLDAVVAGLSVGSNVTLGQAIGRMGNSHQEFLRRCSAPCEQPSERANEGLATRDGGFGPHVHFEVKDRGVLSAMREDHTGAECCYGYTPGENTQEKSMPGHPNWFGYHNSQIFLDLRVERVLSPVPIEVVAAEPAGVPLSVRDYPGVEAVSRIITTIQHRTDQKLPAFVTARAVANRWYQIYLPNAESEGWGASGWIAGAVDQVYSRVNSSLPQVIVVGQSARVRSTPDNQSPTLALAYGGHEGQDQILNQRFVPFEALTNTSGSWYRIYLPQKSAQLDGWINASDAILVGSTAVLPTVVTAAASATTSASATLNGSVNSNGLTTNAWFEWGTSSTLSTFSSTTAQSVSSGTTAVLVSADLTELSPATTYYYRAAATSSAGTAKGAILSVTTLDPESHPDLTITAVVETGYGPGEIQIPVTVTRTGVNLTQGTYVTARLFWSTDAAWGISDTQLWESNGSTPDFPNAVLNSEGSKTVTATVNIPAVSAGSYHILAVADPTNVHPESNENNNVTAYQVTVDDSRPNRASGDRPDEVSGSQIHVMYVLPRDGIDRSLDLDGTLISTVGSFQNWLAGQTGGRRLRMDVFAGVLDITFFRLSRSNAVMTSYGAFVRDTIEKEVAQAGFNSPSKIYAVYYDGGSTFACGGGSWPPALPGRVAAMYLQGTPPGAAPCNTNQFASSPAASPGYIEFAMLHEILHTMGFVSTSAPHHTAAGHVSDDNRDLMYAGPLAWNPSVLDVGRDDYYSDNVPTSVLNLANSQFLLPALSSTLTVEGAGTGSGRVTSSPSLIDCTIDIGSAGAVGCSGSVSGGAVVTLNVILWTGSTVTGWSGMSNSCSGISCQVTMDQTRTITLELGGRAGDLNNDGLVDQIDFTQLIAEWGRTDRPPADINRDGIVDINDHLILIRNWTGGLAVTTEAASGVTSTGATLKGSVKPGPNAATAWFEWGTSPTLATFATTPGQSLPAGTTDIPITAGVTGLTAGTTYYFRAVASNSGGVARDRILSFATPAPMLIIGGTFFDREIGLTGTTFLYDPVHPGGTVPFVDIRGPTSWNGGNPLRCGLYQPPEIAASRSICWAVNTPPATGGYVGSATAGGELVESSFSLDANQTLAAPQITNVVAQTSQVTVEWAGPALAQSFLVRVNPVPFTGVTSERVLSGETRAVTLNGLSLVAGARYQAVVFAFSKDVKTPGDIQGQVNIGAHAIVFTAPTPAASVFATSGQASTGVGTTGPPSDLYVVETTSSGADLLVGRIRTSTGLEPNIRDIAKGPGGGLWAVSPTHLYRLDPQTALATEVGSLNVSSANALAFDSQGRLYTATDFDGSFLEVNTLTGATTRIGTYGSGYSSRGDLAFAPDGTLFATVRSSLEDGILVTVNPETGTATRVGATGFDHVWGLAFVGDQLFGLTTDVGSGKGVLIRIDTSTGIGTLVRNLTFDAFGAGASARRD